MPGTNVPAQMFDFELNHLKGWPSPQAVDYSAPYASGVSGVRAGMVCSLNANGQFQIGVVGSAMAVFMLQSQADFDVLSDVGNVSGGEASGLVAAGSFELQSTEFVDGNYAPNDPLTVENAGADAGKLRVGVPYTDPIVGIVSSGVNESEHDASIDLLAFWPVYLPPTP